MRQDGKQLSIWEHWCFVPHERASFRITRLPDQSRGGWRSGIPWACLYQLRTRSMAFNLVSGVLATPPRFFSRVKLQSVRRVLRDLFQSGATRPCFSTNNSTYVLVKSQAVVQRCCPKLSASFRAASCEISVHGRAAPAVRDHAARLRAGGFW